MMWIPKTGGDLDEAGLRDRLTRLLAELQREENKLKLYAQWIAPLLPSPVGPTLQESASPDSVAGFDTALTKVVLLAHARAPAAGPDGWESDCTVDAGG
jgi:hypothetical protein